MAITAYNAKYNDDVNTPDINGLTPLDKNYLRVLFTPGRSVQSRELNQIQSLLQSQFDSVGRSLFKSNRPVVGGKPSFQRRLHIIEADINKGENELLNYWINNTDLVELQLSQPGTNLRAVPIKIELISSNDVDVDSWRFYVNYNSGNINESGENELVFRNSQIQLKNVVNNSSLDLNPTSLTKIGVAAQVEPGVFFTQGTFVKTEGQLTTAILRDEEIYYTGYVGFKVEENTITSDDDETLLDNAAGSLNFAGIGADRYQIKLTLVLFTPDELEEYNKTIGNFVRLLTIEDSEQIQEITPLDLTSRLEEKLALRTSEESGDYTLKPFPINVHEVWNDDENNGRYTNLLDLQDAGFEDPEIAKNYYGVTLDPSIAYCKGYRVNLPEKDSIFATKSRTLYTELNDGRYLEHSINADMGNYIDVYTSGGLPEIDAFGTIYTLYGDIEKNYYTNSPPFTGDKIGTCKIQSVEGLGSSEQGPILRLYLHKVELLPGLSFKCVLKIQTDTIIDEDNNPNVSTYGQFVGMLLEPGQIFDINVNSSLFDTRLNAIKEYADLRVTEKRSAGNLVYTENNRIRVQFTLTEADEAFDKSPTNLHAVYNAPDLSAGRRYQVFEDFDVIQSESGSILTLDITDSIQNPDGQLRSGGVTNFVPSHSVRILFSVASRLDNNNLGIKKRVSDSYEFGETAENSNGDEVEVVVGGIYQLPNVYHLISVENSEYWQMVEDGQRNTEYVNARVKCLKQDSGNPENTIEFTHWEFSGTGNYYTVQSYRDLDDLYVPLEELPFYGGVPLGDIIDLRLRKDSYNRVALDPYSPIQMEVDVYLPRKDVVCVNTSGKFYILEGEPDFDPVFAKIPSDSMALWQITLPPYVFFIDEIKTKLVDNRRYTMANIRTLENRLANLEYYSLLSLLERGANDESIFDQNGERFKNGWVVDGFRNNAVGNLSHPEALYAINSNLGRAAPFHERDSLPLKIVNSVDTLPSGEFENGGLTEDTIGLRYTTVPYISQPLATQYISVQPWEIASAPGILDLWPEEDTYTSEKSPPVGPAIDVLGGLTDAITFLAEKGNILGQDDAGWGEISSTLGEASVIGTDVVEGERVISEKGGWHGDPAAEAEFERRFGSHKNKDFWRKHIRWDTQVNTTTVTSEQTEYLSQTKETSTTSATVEQMNVSLGRYLTSANIRPFMRSRTIWFLAQGLKPNTRFYGFFDGKNVDDYISDSKEIWPENIISYYWDDFTNKVEELIISWDDQKSDGTLLPFPYTFDHTTHTGLDEETLLNIFPPTPLTSDSKGIIRGVFIVPDNSQLKFVSGEGILRFSDSARNLPSEETSFASSRFVSNGTDVVSDEKILSVKIPTFVQDTQTETKRWSVTTQTVEVQEDVIRGTMHDPVAQSFSIEDPNGICVTSATIYFQNKPSAADAPDVQVYLVSVSDGYPTKNIVPGSISFKSVKDINISQDSNAGTEFEFEEPIYLRPSTEYALVVFSPNTEYRIFIAEMGATKTDLLTGTIIDSQPFLGVFFTSSNKSTWSPFQNQDMKFDMTRAKFDTNPASVYVVPRVGSGITDIEIEDGGLGYTTNGTTVTIDPPMRYVRNSSGDLTKELVPGGITATGEAILDVVSTKITAVKVIKSGWGYEFNPNVYVTDPAASEVVVAKAYRKKSKISSFLLNQRVLNVSDVTSVNNTFKIDNVDYPVYASTPFSDLKNKRYAITRENAIENNRLTMVLQTLDDRVTPKIDRNTLSMNTRYYIINDRADEVGTSKYVSKKISIKNPADQINLTLSINRPAPGCNVKVYIKLFDQTGAIIDPAVTGSIESPNILTPYWFYLPPIAPTSIPVNSLSSAGYIFNDVVYSRNWADDGIEFSSYILKFVFISDNWVDVPRIKDYRSIVTS